MAIRVAPVQSNVIYLQEISEDFQIEEGDCPRDERAWAIVRRGVEGDATQIADLRSRRTVQWISDDTDESSVVPQEMRDVNERVVWCAQAQLCLVDIGGILDENDKPLLAFRNGATSLSRSKFKKAWGKLPEVVMLALLKAVYALNPQWDWLWEDSEKLEDVYRSIAQ